jgi:dTDP-4-dehydrorhamnose 3,5-epimerase
MADIHGVRVIDLTTRGDERGAFTETFRQEWFPEASAMVQANLSRSRAGVLRGLHFHGAQADYWCLLEGTAYVALIDLRAGSPTQRSTWTVNMDAARAMQGIYIPAGVAHGFYAVTDVALQYLVDRGFTGDDERGVAWDDPDLKITWPSAQPTLSARDRSNPSLADVLRDPPAFHG